MKHYSSFLKHLLLLLFILGGLSLSAKKVVCIDDNGDPNDGFLNGHEGWERQEAGPDDIVIKGGSLTDCLDQLEDGDTLVIVAHGNGEGSGFEWGGDIYTGFGDGEGEMPVPADFGEKTIHIKFCTCWSARDPDGPGPDNPDKPLTEKILCKVDTGSTAGGFSDLSEPQVCVNWLGGSMATCKAVNDSLGKDTSWMDKPPSNRPDAPPQTDKSCAQAIAAAIDTSVAITLVYYEPQNVTGVVQRPGSVVIGCACDDGCGLYRAMFEDTADPPNIETPFNFPFPSGLWRQDETLIFPMPTGELLRIRNIRWFDPIGQFLQDVGTGPVPFIIDFVGYAETSTTDNGDFWFTDVISGVVQGTATPLLAPGPNAYYDISIEIVALDFSSNPATPFALVMNPLVPALGVTSILPTEDGVFIVDSFFDVSYEISFGDEPGILACAQAQMYLQCDLPQTGCIDMDSPSFNPCVLEGDGSCQAAVEGCTYPTASNYNPNATQENGTCIFHGCMDPAANNYDPLANQDNGNCDFSLDCPTDINDDGITNTNDLLSFLVAFGSVCPG